MLRIVWLFACCLLLPLPVFAQQEQFKEWQFQIPAGWQFTQQGDFALLIPANAPSGTVYIKLFSGQALSGDLQTWLETQATQDIQGMTVLRNQPVGPLQAGGSPTLQKMVAIQTSNGQKAIRMYVSQSPVSGRAELLLYHTEITQAKAYTAALTSFINTVHFAGAPAADRNVQNQAQQAESRTLQSSPAAGAQTDSSLFNGWYARYMPKYQGGPNFTFTMKPAWEYYRFFTNGWVYTSFPEHADMDSITCPQAGVAEGKCEQYAIRGGMITIGRDRAKSIELISPNEIKISGVAAFRLRPLQVSLVGTYEAVSGGGMLGTASLSISQLTFYRNGTFSTSRSSSVNSTTSASSASAYRNSGGAGQYNITGYDLELRYNTGQVVKTRILAPSDDADLLVIGNSTYIKK